MPVALERLTGMNAVADVAGRRAGECAVQRFAARLTVASEARTYLVSWACILRLSRSAGPMDRAWPGPVDSGCGGAPGSFVLPFLGATLGSGTRAAWLLVTVNAVVDNVILLSFRERITPLTRSAG